MGLNWIVVVAIAQIFWTTCFANLPGTSQNANNIFDALTMTLTCGQFQSLIKGAGLTTENTYKSEIRLTLFVANNTAFQQLPPFKLNAIINMSPTEKEDYVKFHTVSDEMLTSSMVDNAVKKSIALDNNRLFFNKRTRRTTDIGGNAGTTDYYVNGARIIRANMRAGNGIIHLIDRVIEKSVPRPAYSYLRRPDTTIPTKETSFFRELLNYITGEFLSDTIMPIQSATKLTLFLPSDEAIAAIRSDKLEELRSVPQKLAQVIQQHVILDKVIYTSYIYHNEGFNSMYRRNLFKTNVKSKVYISGGGVNAEIIKGNITLNNGVIHIIDNILGYVYNTAREQIQLDQNTKYYEDLTNRGRKELQDFLVIPKGVTVFVPTNDAFNAIANIPGVDLYNNQTLINEVLERSMLEPGIQFEITNVFGDYNSRSETTTQYRGMKIKVYSQGNDTWAEGGYVKAHVIRPDIGVTNGYVHYIDGIFGVPSRDMPSLIYCEDWLLKTSYVLSITNLNNYMKDVRITQELPPCPSTAARQTINYVNNGYSSSSNSNNQNTASTNYGSDTQTRQYQKLITGGCGESNKLCEFTMFIPNGTAIDNFQMTELGLRIMQDRNRLREVMKRHIIVGRKYYLDTLGMGTHSLRADNGDYLRMNKISNTYTEVYYKGQRTRVLHSDLGATNGVIHIVDRVLHEEEDLTRELSGAATIFSNINAAVSIILCITFLFLTAQLY